MQSSLLFLMMGSLFSFLPLKALHADEAPSAQQGENTAFASGEDISLSDFLNKVAKEANITIVITADVENQMRNKKLRLVNVSSLEIPKEDVFEANRAILFAHSLVLIRIGPISTPLYLLQNLRSGSARTALVPIAKFVPVEELGNYENRTELIRTVIHLTHMDISRARTELNNLVSQQYGSINSVQSTNSLIITEFGPTVYKLYQLLSRMDQHPCDCHEKRHQKKSAEKKKNAKEETAAKS